MAEVYDGVRTLARVRHSQSGTARGCNRGCNSPETSTDEVEDPTRTAHSRGVASLAGGAASFLGLPSADVATVRRAGWLHDVGVIGVSSTVWTEPGPWTFGQRERARAHPYLTERMLARAPALRRIGQCASLHHERLDGSGYPKGLTADSIPVSARVLAAADVYDALRHRRRQRRTCRRRAPGAEEGWPASGDDTARGRSRRATRVGSL